MRYGAAALVLLCLASCGSTMDLQYEFALTEPVESTALEWSDEHFGFRFDVAEDGLYVSVANQTESMGRIDWSRSYFIEPSGATYPALDVAVYHSPKSVKDSPTLLPPRSIVTRYTTSVGAVAERNIRVTTMTGFSSASASGSGSGSDTATFRSLPARVESYQEWTSSYSGYSTSSALALSFDVRNWGARRFYPGKQGVRQGSYYDALQRVAQQLAQTGQFALGLHIEHDEGPFEYRFGFTVDRAIALAPKAAGVDEQGDNVYEHAPLYEATSPDWVWTHIETGELLTKPKPPGAALDF